jgi:hypothetical protein
MESSGPNQMSAYFSAEYALAWAIAIAAVLWYPLRILIWNLLIRRAKLRADELNEIIYGRLQRRAMVTAALLGLVIGTMVVNQFFGTAL